MDFKTKYTAKFNPHGFVIKTPTCEFHTYLGELARQCDFFRGLIDTNSEELKNNIIKVDQKNHILELFLDGCSYVDIDVEKESTKDIVALYMLCDQWLAKEFKEMLLEDMTSHIDYFNCFIKLGELDNAKVVANNLVLESKTLSLIETREGIELFVMVTMTKIIKLLAPKLSPQYKLELAKIMEILD